MDTLRLTVLPFTVIDGELKVYLKKGEKGSYASLSETLAGNTSPDETAGRLFTALTKIPDSKCYQEQLYTFSYSSKIVIAYYMLVPSYLLQGERKNWISVKKVTISDKEILEYAVQRLRWKVEYTNVVYSLLPAEFTLSELQMTYEAILRRILDKRNFRKKILSLGILDVSKHIRSGIKARPAHMYEFRDKKMVMVKVF